MDVKKEPFDPHAGVIKTEPDLVSSQTEENNSYFKRQQMHESVFDGKGNIIDSKTKIQFVNVEIKQEIIECEISKIEPDSVVKNVQITPTVIKKEIENPTEVNGGNMFVDIKHELSEYIDVHLKEESKFINIHHDLPTLKNEVIDYPDYFTHLCNENTADVSKKKKKKKKRWYPCLVCQKNFSSSKSRTQHIDGHFRKRRVVCEFCGKLMTKIDFFRHYLIHLVKNKTRKVYKKVNEVSKVETIYMNSIELTNHTKFRDSSNLPKHFKISRIKLPFKCDICFKEFKQRSILHEHFKIIHNVEKLFKCNICSKKFKRKNNLQEHLLIHTDVTPFKCHICSKECKLKSGLQKHLKMHTNEKPFKCNICSKGFKRKNNLQVHLLIHTDVNPYKCDICSQELKLKSYLQKHLKIHTNEKPFKCNICSKEFKRKTYLQEHLIIHSDERPFKCDICYKEFKTNSNLHQHLNIHAYIKLFKCDICSMEFKLKSNLQKHLQIHTNEKPFKCNICSKEFKRKKYLQEHLIIHNDEKPFKCDICYKKFKTNSSLHRHLIIHAETKPFSCDICSKGFTQKFHLQKHLKYYHTN